MVFRNFMLVSEIHIVFNFIARCGNDYPAIFNLPELVKDLLTAWADNQYSSGMLQEALTSGCLGPTGKLGKTFILFFLSSYYRVKSSTSDNM